MDELIYKIDNWSIVKLVGGLSFVIVTALSFGFYIIQSRILDRLRLRDQKEIETLKGLIDKNNSVLSTVLSKSLPDKIVEKRLEALDKLWGFVIETKNKPPAAVRLAYSILADKEINLENLKKLSKGQLELIPIENLMMGSPLITDLEHLRYLVPPKLWTTVFIYQAFVNRICYVTVNGLQKGKFAFWKTDDPLKDMIGNVLNEKEVKYIYDAKFQSYDILLNLLEHKILMESNKILSGENETEDSLKVVKRIADLTTDPNRASA